MKAVFSLLLAISALSACPADAVAAACADLQLVAPELRGQTRYASLYNVAAKDRPAVVAALSYALNAVSRSKAIVAPEPASPFADLLRIDLGAYADLKRSDSYSAIFQAWEKLATKDPYFHLQTEVAVPQAGKIEAKIKQLTVDGGWVGLQNAALLRSLSGSFGAVLRADWLAAQLLAPPAYYEWIGMPSKEADFYRGLGLNLKSINDLAADSAANLFRSDVTGKPRRIIYRPGPLGGVWLTKDAGVDAANRNPIRNPIDFADQRFVFDATEVFFAMPNKFWGTALFSATGQRQDAVPPEIATDTTAPAGFQQVIPLISCVRCHEKQGWAGMQPFVDDQTLLPTPQSHIPAVARRIAELYSPPRLSKEMQRDRADYVDAVREATGLDPAGATNATAAVYEYISYRLVDATMAAHEIGLAPQQFSMVMAGSGDPAILALLAGRKVTRRTWEGSFQEAALLAAGWLGRN